MFPEIELTPKGVNVVFPKIPLLWEDVEEIGNWWLKEMLYSIESVGTQDDVDTWDAINQVLAYTLPPVELKELSDREIPKNWVSIVAQKSAEARQNKALDDLAESLAKSGGVYYIKW